MSHSTRVLIVDEDQALAASLSRYLGRRGWRAEVSTSGQQAAAAGAGFAPDVVLFDHRLPDMDGFQALRLVRAMHPACGAVLMTDEAGEQVTAGIEQWQIRRILCKPFTLDTMESQLISAFCESIPRIAMPGRL